MAMPTPIDRITVQRFLTEGALLLEVLPAADYEGEHIAGAVSLPLTTIRRQTVADLDPERPTITYCYDHQ
jgi:rhodanese-related sulfurtransferase